MKSKKESERVEIEEEKEMLKVGAKILDDMRDLLWNSSSAIKTNFTHATKIKLGGTEEEPIRDPILLLFFTIREKKNSSCFGSVHFRGDKIILHNIPWRDH